MNTSVYQSRVAPREEVQTMVRVGTTPESFGSRVGAALENVGQAAQNIDRVMSMKRAIDSDTNVRERVEQYRARTRDVEARYLTSEGSAALGRARTDYLEQLEEARQQLAAELTSPGEREAFLQNTSAITMTRGDAAARHEAAQGRQANLDARGATVEGFIDDALDNWNDDSAFEFNLERAADETRALAALRGAPPEVTERAVENTVADTVQNRVVLMADRDPAAALTYLREEPRLSATRKLEIEQNLEPLVREQRVARMVNQFVVRGSDTGGGYSGMVAGAESSGGRDMYNRTGSSAQGWFGFTDGTYADVLSEMERAGRLPPALAGMSASERQQTRHDKAISSAVHDFWVEGNTRLLASIGAEATPQNLYTMHHFGRGAGPEIVRLARESPNTPARALYARNGWNWGQVVAQNPGIGEGVTVGELFAYAGRHIGRGAGLTNQNTISYDYAAAYDFAQSIEDPDDRAAFLAEVQSREATTTRAEQARRGEVIDRVTEEFIANGTSELSLTDKLLLGREGLTTFQSFVKGYSTGGLQTEPEVYDTLLGMMASQNQQTLSDFAADGSLEKYRAQLTDDDYRYFQGQRARVRGELEGAQLTQEQLARNPSLAVPIKAEHLQAITRRVEQLDVPEGQQTAAKGMMERRLRQQMLDFYNENQRAPAEHEVDRMLYAQSMVIQPGGLGRDMFVFDYDSLADGERVEPIQPYESVPTSERERIAAVLSETLGRAPTREEIAVAYTAHTFAQGQISVDVVGLEEVPPEAYSAGQSRGLDDEEIAELWQLYLVEVLAGRIRPAPIGPQAGARVPTAPAPSGGVTGPTAPAPGAPAEEWDSDFAVSP